MFQSTLTSFFVTLYNVSIEKVLITPQKVTVTDEKMSVTSQKLSIKDAINSLNAKKLFAFMNFDGVFGRSDIMEITNISIIAAGTLLNILKSAAPRGRN